jgi:formylglycine-generating enzyme required for sulfatase activity
MHGNVWEWCRDGLRQYTNAAVINPAEPSDSLCAVRGGSWFHVARLVRSAYRYAYSPDVRTADLGFRFSLRPVSPERAMRSEKP